MNPNGNKIIDSMPITVLPIENTTIMDKVPLKLGKYTIFAGENNAGKTNLMKALLACLPNEQTIYIPAESIAAEEQLKTTASADPMRTAFLKLINVTVDQLPKINYKIVEGFLKKITKTFDSFGVPNINLTLSVKKLNKGNIEKIVRDEVSKKILDSVVKDNYGSGKDIKINAVGQGTQRLITAAILQEVSKVKTQSKELFLIFEEPEIYLHPELKKSLHESLVEISEKNIRVIITTHDSYFIELGANQKIYKVFRNPAKKYATDVEEMLVNQILPYPSHSEVNYTIFDLPSKEFFQQLYESIKSRSDKARGISSLGYDEFDTYMFTGEPLKLGQIKKGKKDRVTLLSAMRHAIAHPSKTNQTLLTEPNLRNGIEKLLIVNKYQN